MIALKVGTTSWRAAESLAGGEVEFVGEWITAPDGFTPYMVWDAGLNNCRAMTAGEIAALPGQRATQAAQQAKTAATSGIDKGAAVVGDKTERLVRALMEIILDEFNLHAAKHNAVLDAADAAASLADFKTRVALIPDYPTRTAAQLVSAIKAKIAASAE